MFYMIYVVICHKVVVTGADIEELRVSSQQQMQTY